ncbi:MAG: hypothetical protein EPN34_04280 [Burkholderiaceae bacterium]|jgi:hypothetical protein|nr:MAG: hypothetical protein EPN34_04280 [Burkholderiaceae bacterium]
MGARLEAAVFCSWMMIPRAGSKGHAWPKKRRDDSRNRNVVVLERLSAQRLPANVLRTRICGPLILSGLVLALNALHSAL